MSEPADVHNPVRSVPLRTGELVEVRELSWKDYLRAVKELTATLLKMIGGETGELSLSAITLDKDKLIEGITEQENLVTWLLCRSTGRDQKWADALSAHDCLSLLAAVVDLNLNAEVVGLGKKVAGRMGEVFASMTNSPAPVISSSSPATPSTK